MIKQTDFYFVRHGQTDWNLNRTLQGASDIALNATGIEQANEAREKLKSAKIATICSSPLIRARKTADIINQEHGCQIIEHDGLMECNFGSHEGRPIPKWLHDWLDGNADIVPPDVETFEHFLNRTLAAINAALENPGPVLVVAHGGVFIPVRMNLDPQRQTYLPNCQPVHCMAPANGNGWVLEDL